MKIAIDCADLDHSRIDGTRVYIKHLLNWFGSLDSSSKFFLYHKGEYNPLLAPKEYPNYIERKIPYSWWWTQTRFAFELRKDKPDVCWMPIQQVPFIGPRKTKYVVTIHDLAFKIFSDQFPASDKRKLNFFADTAIKRADRIIAISDATKKDIVKFYPKVDEKKIFVVHHGFDVKLFSRRCAEDEILAVLKKHKIIEEISDLIVKNQSTIDNPSVDEAGRQSYILYVGAIQPRKNLVTLIKAFENLKNDENNGEKGFKHLKLVLVGEPSWKAEKTLNYAKNSPHKNDIVLTGKVGFNELRILYQGAKIFVFPSLYEGFGIPILEAFACGVPVVVAGNSSLIEVGGDAVKVFKNRDHNELSGTLQKVLNDSTIREEMIRRGLERAKQFSWKKCAKETLEVLKNVGNE